MQYVVDVSNNNGVIDWHLAAPHVHAAGLKASEGRHFQDGYYAANAHGCKLNGLPFLAYHFARFTDPEDEAKNFLDVIGKRGLPTPELRPCLDCEVAAPVGIDRVEWCREWNHFVHRQLGTFPIFYSNPATIGSMFTKRSGTVGSGLWLAAYGSDTGAPFPVDAPRPWRKVLMHQYTERGSLPGVSGHVDYSSISDVRLLAAKQLP